MNAEMNRSWWASFRSLLPITAKRQRERTPTDFILSPALRDRVTLTDVVSAMAIHPHCLDPIIDTWARVEVIQGADGAVTFHGLVRRSTERTRRLSAERLGTDNSQKTNT